ncbi:SDR family oxidoreductase [Arthrobacter sp. D1-29]
MGRTENEGNDVGGVVNRFASAPSALSGKAVIVTGAGQGLGRAYALACGRAGASVVVNDVDGSAAEETAAALRTEGVAAISVAGSVATWDDAERTVAESIAAFGRLDGLVANAAIMHMGAPWDETEDQLRLINQVNVLGVQFTARHAMRAMVEAGRGGSIVTIVSGAQHGIHGMSAYGATKGAVNAMTANWAIEGQEHGIRVNAVSPWAMTQMTLDHLDETKADRSSFPEPAQISPLVVALLSDETSSVSGHIIRFDGITLSQYETSLVPIAAQEEVWSAKEISALLVRKLGSLTTDVSV